jgi:NAD(P)H-dependent FMN reductase
MTPSVRLGQLRVLGIGGSLRVPSFSGLALEHAIRLVRETGCRTEIFDLQSNPLPFCNGDQRDLRPDYPAVAKLRRSVTRAHALILATPEYHGGMSGVLKNVLDLLDFEHLRGKVVGAISVLGGSQNSNALNDIRRVLRWCNAWVIPEQIAIGHARNVFVDLRICDPDLLSRFDDFVQSLLRTTFRLSDNFLPEGIVPDLRRSQADSIDRHNLNPVRQMGNTETSHARNGSSRGRHMVVGK